MPEKILELVAQGVDLHDPATAQTIAEQLSDMSWGSMNGLVTVSMLVDFDDLVSVGSIMQRRIQRALPDIRLLRVFEDFVTTAEIAFRADVTREAVRLWANAERGSKPFPEAHQVVGTGKNPSPIWKWSHVAAWLAAHRHPVDSFIYPTDQEAAEINANLAKITSGSLECTFPHSAWVAASARWNVGVTTPLSTRAIRRMRISGVVASTPPIMNWRDAAPVGSQ